MTLNEKKDRLLNYIDRLVKENALDPVDASAFAERVDSVRTDMDLLDLQVQIDKASSQTIERVRGTKSATKAEPEPKTKTGKKGGKKGGTAAAATSTGEVTSFADVMKKGMFTPEQQRAIDQAKLQTGAEAAAAGDPAFQSNVAAHNRRLEALTRKVREVWPYAQSEAKVEQLAGIIAKRFAAILPAEQQAKMSVADWQKLIHGELQNWVEKGIPEDVQPEILAQTEAAIKGKAPDLFEDTKARKDILRRLSPSMVRDELGMVTPELTQRALQTAGIAATPGGRFVPGITLPTTLDKTFQDAAQYAIEKGEITKRDLIRDLKLGPKTADNVLAQLQEAHIIGGPTGTGDLGSRRASTAAATAKTSNETYRALATREEWNAAIGSIPTSTGEPRRMSLEGSPDKLTRTTPVGTPEAEAARIKRVAIKRARVEKGLIPVPQKGDTASAVRRAVQGEIQKLAVHDMATAQATIEILKADKKFSRFIPTDIEKQVALPDISSTMPVPQDRLTFSVTARGYAEQLKGELKRLAGQTRKITPQMIEPLLGGRLPTGKVAQEVLAIWQAEGLIGEGMEHLVNLNLNKREFVQALASIANSSGFKAQVTAPAKPAARGLFVPPTKTPPAPTPTPVPVAPTVPIPVPRSGLGARPADVVSRSGVARTPGGQVAGPGFLMGNAPNWIAGPKGREIVPARRGGPLTKPGGAGGPPAARRPFRKTGPGIFGRVPAGQAMVRSGGALGPATEFVEGEVIEPRVFTMFATGRRELPGETMTATRGRWTGLYGPGKTVTTGARDTTGGFVQGRGTFPADEYDFRRSLNTVVDEAGKAGPKTAAAESAAAGMMPTRASRLKGALRTARKHPIGTALGAAWLVPELVRGGFEVADVIRGGDERRMDKQIAHEKEMARLQMQIERLEAGGGVTPDAVMRKYRLEQLVSTRAQLLAERDPGLAQILSGLPELTPNEFVVGAKPNTQALRDFIEADIIRRGEDRQ